MAGFGSPDQRGCMAAGLLAFFIALFVSWMLVAPVRALALRVGMVDLPGPRKVHLTPIPLLGGLAMYAAVVIAVLSAFSGPARSQIAGILIGATLVAAVGVLDDRGLLHHQIKLFVGMPLAAAILLISGIRAQVFGALLGGRGAGFRFFRAACLPERTNSGHHAGRRRLGRGDRIFALEFQARKNLHGRWRGDVSWFPDGHARTETAP